MIDLLALKEEEIRHKYASIEGELQAWLTLTEKNAALEKHHSQVRLLVRELEGMIGAVTELLESLPAARQDAAQFFSTLLRAQFLILEVHRTWQYFREKLALRQAPPYDQLLEAMDEVVWQCYVQLLNAERREPPLVVFSGERSPVASFRHTKLDVTALAAVRQDVEFQQARLKTLAIPMITLPWFESTYLPEALMLGHEVGHIVDLERGVTDEISTVLATSVDIPEKHRKDFWVPWRFEVFADLYGALCLGPAYGWTLAALLSDTTHAVLATLDAQKRYPPHYLRMELVLTALQQRGFVEEAARIRQSWEAQYDPGTSRVLHECMSDVPHIVRLVYDSALQSLCGTDGKARSLSKVDGLPWSTADQRQALKLMERLRANQPDNRLKAALPTARRALVAAQLLLVSLPPANREPKALLKQQERIIKIILSTRESGTRGRFDKPHQTQDDAARASGLALAKALLNNWDKQATLAVQAE